MQLPHEYEQLRTSIRRRQDDKVKPFVDEPAVAIFPACPVFDQIVETGLLGLSKPVKSGGMNLVKKSLITRFYSDMRLSTIVGGADELMLQILSRNIRIPPK